MILFHYLFDKGLKSCKLSKPKDKAAVNVNKKQHKIKIKNTDKDNKPSKADYS